MVEISQEDSENELRELEESLWQQVYRFDRAYMEATRSTSKRSQRSVWYGHAGGVYACGRQEGSLACEMLAERIKRELFEPPTNVLFLDARGEAARVVFDAEGERRILH